MGLERRGRVVRGCVRSINRTVVREESRGRAESTRQAVRYFEAGGLGGVGEGQGEQGRTGSGRAVDRGVREGSEGQSVQDLESDVVGVVLPAAGACGGDPEGAWRRHQNAGCADRGRSGRADGGGRGAGGEGRADLPSGLLRVPPEAFRARRGGRVPAAVLADGLGDRSGHPEVLRQRAVGPGGQGGRGEHRPAVGGAVCEAVAARAAAAARRDACR